MVQTEKKKEKNIVHFFLPQIGQAKLKWCIYRSAKVPKKQTVAQELNNFGIGKAFSSSHSPKLSFRRCIAKALQHVPLPTRFVCRTRQRRLWSNIGYLYRCISGLPQRDFVLRITPRLLKASSLMRGELLYLDELVSFVLAMVFVSLLILLPGDWECPI